MNLAKEFLPPGEEEATQRIIKLLKQRLSREYPAGQRMLRDAHPKQHGLVKAEFTVESELPEQLRVGVFRGARTFPACIRFSNMSDPPQPDANSDSRGMAIKLMEVPGEKLLAGETQAATQDFVLMSTDYFVTKDVAGFADFVEAVEGGKLRLGWHLVTHPRLSILFLKSRQKCANPLSIPYGSTTPYLFGDQAVKYSVRPSEPTADNIPANPSPNYLREAMVRHLADREANFDFCVQFQTHPAKMPIEDPRVIWSPSLSPLVKVARIRIMQQQFDSPAQQEYGDNLSFTPWHCLPEHRPLGGINRARKLIYETMSKFRHDRNGVTPQEPVEWISF